MGSWANRKIFFGDLFSEKIVILFALSAALLQLIGNQLVDLMHVINHKEGGDGASLYRIAVDVATPVKGAAVFCVDMLFGKTDGAGIAVDRFQINGTEPRKSVFRAIRAAFSVRKDDHTFIRDGVNGVFQNAAFSEKYIVKHHAAEGDKEDAEQTEEAAYGSCRDSPENGEAHPEDGEDR